MVGMAGMVLQGAAPCTRYSLGFSGRLSTGSRTGGMAVYGAAAVEPAWIFTGNSGLDPLYNILSADTKLRLIKDQKPISEIKIGDQVLAYNEVKEKMVIIK
jgi:hypothetical protein